MVSDPLGALAEKQLNHWPASFIFSVHVYHMAFFDNLDWIDWLHHLLMVVVGKYKRLCFACIRTRPAHLSFFVSLGFFRTAFHMVAVGKIAPGFMCPSLLPPLLQRCPSPPLGGPLLVTAEVGLMMDYNHFCLPFKPASVIYPPLVSLRWFTRPARATHFHACPSPPNPLLHLGSFCLH
jgi:hypothetical protein